MDTRHAVAFAVAVTLGASHIGAQEPRSSNSQVKGTTMTSQATGTFDVKVAPLPADEKVKGLEVGRFSINKEWKGDIEGTSVGEMMTVGSEVKGSGAYVAVEHVTASLKGRRGTFTFIHQATMRSNSEFNMSIKVSPDSGTGDLAGLAGSIEIIIEGKNHSYKFDYTLPEKT